MHAFAEVPKLDVRHYRAEWKWDGIRVQLVAGGGARRLFSRTGEEISGTFPDIVEAMDFDAVLDGELLVLRDGEVAPFNDLQQRLNRKTGRRVAEMLQARIAGTPVAELQEEWPVELVLRDSVAPANAALRWSGSSASSNAPRKNSDALRRPHVRRSANRRRSSAPTAVALWPRRRD